MKYKYWIQAKKHKVGEKGITSKHLNGGFKTKELAQSQIHYYSSLHGFEFADQLEIITIPVIG